MTFEEGQKNLDSLPTNKTTTRREFAEANYASGSGEQGDCNWSFMVNYTCLDPYSDKQRIQLDGAYLSVWANNQTTSVHEVIQPGEDLRKKVIEMYERARIQCPHTFSRAATDEEIKKAKIQMFRCVHAYTCEVCSATYSVDSSG